MFDTIRQFSELRESFQSLDAYDDLMYVFVCMWSACGAGIVKMYKCAFLYVQVHFSLCLQVH